MPTYALSTDQPILWAVTQGGVVIAAGQQPANAITFAAETNAMLSDTSENAFLGKVAGKAGAYQPLPAAGAPLQTGEIYGYGGGLVMVRQTHTRTADAPADVPALFTVYRAGGADVLDWVQGERVEVGTRRTHGGKTYACLQAHQTEYAPDLVPALWSVVNLTAEWVSGEQGLAVGDQRTYQGVTYRTRQPVGANIWPPPTVPALWEAV